MISRLKPGGPGTSGTGLPERASIEPASATRENNSEQRSCSLHLSLSLSLALYRHPEIWNPCCRTVSSEPETVDLFSRANFTNQYDLGRCQDVKGNVYVYLYYNIRKTKFYPNLFGGK